ncbi:MAG: copper amine oxidase N-terminal domain-containing protein [Clostridiaceae bacterium]|nr:copper amine oxidase N-terminal domain-containing protein [Clostridiaceae bacterium]
MVLLGGVFVLRVFAIDFSDAQLISVNNPVSGRLANYNTVNYYKFTLNSPGKVKISFSHGNVERNTELWRIQMFNADETEIIDFSSRGNTPTSESINTYLASGTYYIRIKSHSRLDHSDENYKLLVSFVENNNNYEIESNDSYSEATLIKDLGKEITGNCHHYKDVDYYKVVIPENSKVYITFAHSYVERSTDVWIIQMFDSDEREILELNSRGTSTKLESRNLYLCKGEYYIRVRPNGYLDHSTADYRLSVICDKNNGQYEIEPNNTFGTASPINWLAHNVTGNISSRSDKDYYKFYVTAPGNYSISFTHGNIEDSIEFWEIHLFDSDQNVLGKFSSRGTQTKFESKSLALSKGEYYVRVQSGGWGYSTADYNIAINSSSGGKIQSYVDSPPSEGTMPSQPDTIKVTVNGMPIEFDQPPILENGRTLVPLRAIFTALGASVDWNGNNMTITSTKGSNTIVMQVGKTVMTKNGKEIILDVPPKLLNGRTLVPVRAVAESFDANVQWDGTTRTVIITTN